MKWAIAAAAAVGLVGLVYGVNRWSLNRLHQTALEQGWSLDDLCEVMRAQGLGEWHIQLLRKRLNVKFGQGGVGGVWGVWKVWKEGPCAPS